MLQLNVIKAQFYFPIFREISAGVSDRTQFLVSFTVYSSEDILPFIIDEVNISFSHTGVKSISEQESIIRKTSQGKKL